MSILSAGEQSRTCGGNTRTSINLRRAPYITRREEKKNWGSQKIEIQQTLAGEPVGQKNFIFLKRPYIIGLLVLLVLYYTGLSIFFWRWMASLSELLLTYTMLISLGTSHLWDWLARSELPHSANANSRFLRSSYCLLCLRLHFTLQYVPCILDSALSSSSPVVAIETC